MCSITNRQPSKSEQNFDDIRTFADVLARLGEVTTLEALSALNDAVEARFCSDTPKLTMTDKDWEEWTQSLARTDASIDSIRFYK